MIISHKHKFVFICIPKTATTTMRYLIYDIDNDFEIVYLNSIPNLTKYKDIPSLKFFNNFLSTDVSKAYHAHLPFNLIKNLDKYKLIKDYTFFAIIRNPIDIVFSALNFSNNNANIAQRIENILISPRLNYFYVNDDDKITEQIHFIKYDCLEEDLISFLSNFKSVDIKIAQKAIKEIRNKTIYTFTKDKEIFNNKLFYDLFKN